MTSSYVSVLKDRRKRFKVQCQSWFPWLEKTKENQNTKEWKIREVAIAIVTIKIGAACYRTDEAQIPKSAGQSAGKSAGKKGDCWGVFCRVQCHAHQGHQKIAGSIGPGSTFGTPSARAKRGAHFCKNPLVLRTPPFLGS